MQNTINQQEDASESGCEPEPVGWGQRLFAFGYYVGLGPVLGVACPRNQSRYSEFHSRQAMALFFVLFVIGAVFALTMAYLSYSLVFNREAFENSRLADGFLTGIRLIAECWLVFLLFGGVMCLRGSLQPIPIVWRITGWQRLLRVTAVLNGIALIILVVGGSVATHAHTLAREGNSPAKVYMVYDDINFWPRWIFTLGFYRVSLAAHDEWGSGAVSVVPLTKQSLRRAVRNGHFVFVSSHGTEKGLFTTDNVWILPKDIPEGTTSDALKYVYITGCDSGAQAERWEMALAPAKVKTFDRLSAVVEHIYWLWIRGPGRIHEIAAALGEKTEISK